MPSLDELNNYERPENDTFVIASPPPAGISRTMEEFGTKSIIHDEFYYFTPVIFLVEDCLFKVPRYMFEEQSEFFRAMFQLPVADGVVPDGLSDEQPLRLDMISKTDFRRLLKVMYPRPSQRNEKFTTAEWTSVLCLSTMWDLVDIRKQAIEEMTPELPPDPVEQVVIATKYNVQQWLLPALNSLAQRANPLSIEDFQKLGLETAVKIAAIRESCTYNERRYAWELTEKRGRADLDFTARIRANFHLVE